LDPDPYPDPHIKFLKIIFENSPLLTLSLSVTDENISVPLYPRIQVKDGWGMPPVSRETNLTPMGQDLWGLSRPPAANKQQPPGGWPAPAANGWSNGTNANPALGGGSAWLLLRNLTAQIDGSTLRTLCMQHGPLNNFHLYLTHGIALAKYSNGSEAKKVGFFKTFLGMYRMRIRDSTYHPDADPDLDFYLMRIRIFYLAKIGIRNQMRTRIRPKPLVKGSNRLIFHTFWLVICKLMLIRVRFWTQIIILKRIRIRNFI